MFLDRSHNSQVLQRGARCELVDTTLDRDSTTTEPNGNEKSDLMVNGEIRQRFPTLERTTILGVGGGVGSWIALSVMRAAAVWNWQGALVYDSLRSSTGNERYRRDHYPLGRRDLGAQPDLHDDLSKAGIGRAHGGHAAGYLRA